MWQHFLNIIIFPIRWSLYIIIMAFVYLYRYTISPLTPASCRHIPTCSEYMIEAIRKHGVFKGLLLGIQRLSKCHPWGTHGYDPVPPKDTKVIKFNNLNTSSFKNTKKKNS